MRLPNRRPTVAVAALGAALLVTMAPEAWQSAPTPEQRVAAFKQALQENQARLRKYEWVQTTIISLKGEEKSRKQERCYYGADGKVQKLPVGEPPAADDGGGRRGRGGRLKQRVVENKKDEMQEYMARASALVHHYVPPNPDDIEKAKTGGKMAIKPGAAGRAQLEFTDYLKAGDRLAIDVDAASNRLLAVNVASYLDAPDDAVTLDVAFTALPDGTNYNAQTTLDAKAKNIRVVIQNSGYRPVQQ